MISLKRLLRSVVLTGMALGGCLILNPVTPPANSASPGPAEGATSQGRAGKGEYILLFAGDVMLSRTVGLRMKESGDWSLPFRLIASDLSGADLRYCNLECPISDRGSNRYHLYSFRADPRALEGLKTARFDVVSQANNHAYDWGPEALLDSMDRLRQAGIKPVGAGQNILAAHYPLLVHLGSLRIAFLAYVNIDPKGAAAGIDRPGVAWLDAPQALTDIRFARPLADVVIVCPHWGVEYALRPTSEQVSLAHAMIDAGADMVVGSHPHVVQLIENYHNHWIAYSLGNFIFDQQGSATRRGLLLRVAVRDNRVSDVRPMEININSSFQADLAPPDKSSSPPIMARTGNGSIHPGE